MALDAQQIEEMQNAVPTDWSKFGGSIAPSDFNRGMFAGDDTLHVRFFIEARIDVEKSTEANRPIYRDVPYVEMMMRGDKNNIVIEPVWDQHKRRFPDLWEQFKRGEEQQVQGTPLKAAPFLTPSHVAELNYMKIFTVEQLATLPDSAMGFMGAQEYKQAAKRYLEKTSGSEALMERIKKLEAALEAQQAVPIDVPLPAPPQAYEEPRKNFGKGR